MRLEMRPGAIENCPGMRSATPDDQASLAALMLAAYAGGTDVDGEETIDDARAEIQRTFDGDYGELLLGPSTVVTADDRIVAATLITLHEALPLVTFTMTHPDWKRRGLARTTLARAINELLALQHATLDLVVTAANAPAVTLYRDLGFEDLGEAQGPPDQTIRI